MPDMLEELTRKTIEEILKSLPAEERLKGLSADERLEGISEGEFLANLSPQKRAALARLLKEDATEPPAS